MDRRERNWQGVPEKYAYLLDDRSADELKAMLARMTLADEKHIEVDGVLVASVSGKNTAALGDVGEVRFGLTQLKNCAKKQAHFSNQRLVFLKTGCYFFELQEYPALPSNQTKSPVISKSIHQAKSLSG